MMIADKITGSVKGNIQQGMLMKKIMIGALFGVLCGQSFAASPGVQAAAAHDESDIELCCKGLLKAYGPQAVLLREEAYKDVRIVYDLLNCRGVEPAGKDRNGWTALHWAAMSCHFRSTNDIGKAVNAILQRIPRSKREQFVNAETTKGESALCIAASAGHAGMVQALLDAGAEPRRRRFGGLTPRDRALQAGNVTIAGLLEKRELVLKILDAWRGSEPLRAGLQGILLECDETALRLKCNAEFEAVPVADLQALVLDEGALQQRGRDFIRKYEREALPYAGAFMRPGAITHMPYGKLPYIDGAPPIFDAVKRKSLPEVRELIAAMDSVLQRRDFVNEVDSHGWGPLHYAARGGMHEIGFALLEAGADPALKTPDGFTVLDLAQRRLATSQSQTLSLVDYLALHPTVKQANRHLLEEKYGPLEEALRQPEVLADPVLVLKLLMNGANPLVITDDGGTVLHAAVAAGNCETLCLLLKELTRVRMPTVEAWHEFLMRKKEGVGTVLHAAAYEGCEEMVEEILLAVPRGPFRTAFITARNSDGLQAIDVATRQKHTEVFAVLIKQPSVVAACINLMA